MSVFVLVTTPRRSLGILKKVLLDAENLNLAPPPTGTTVDRHCVHARLHEPHRGGGPRGRLGFFGANPSTSGIAMLQLPWP